MEGSMETEAPAPARQAGGPARRRKRRQGRSLPLFVQIVALLVAGVMLAQLVNVVIVLSSPPPSPVRYQPGQVADLLAGTVGPGARPNLVLSHSKMPPPDGWEDPEEREYRTFLARMLQVRPDQARVVLRYAGSAPSGTSTSAVPPPMPRTVNPFRLPGEYSKFSAAVQRPDGTWLTARPRDDRWLQPWQKRLLLWFLGTALLVALLGYVFARRLTAPITKFAAAAERLGRNPHAAPLELEGPAEIGAAARAFNEMQERLQRYVEDRTAMIAAIAHDLRTPLTRLRFRLEAAPEDLRQRAVADIAEMEAMVAATLAFVRDATRPAIRDRLELRSLLESIADNMTDTRHDVAVEVGAPIVLSGDPVALRSLFANLLDNAVKYGRRAHVSARVEGKEAVVHVDDEGPGLPEKELKQVFEPFYRAEPSRNRDTGGIGLGLAVVRSIVNFHGGEIRLENRPEGGLRATVRLPL
jgi:two-component system OmpR family sensor kinase